MPKIQKSAAKPAAATTSTTAAPAAATEFRLATHNPEEFQSVGLASNFWGTIVDKFYGIMKHEKGKKAGTYGLAAYVVIQPDPDAEVSTNAEINAKLGVPAGLVVERLGAGDLTHWVPLTEEMVPAGHPGYSVADYLAMGRGKDAEGRAVAVPDTDLPVLRGVYVGSVGSQQSLPKGTKWDQFLAAEIAAGYPVENTKSPDVRFDVGLRAYWVRLPFEFKGGKDGKGDIQLEPGQRAPDLLCVTEIDPSTIGGGNGKATTGGGKTAAAAKAPTVAAASAPAPAKTVAPAAARKPAAPSADLADRVEQSIVRHATAVGGTVAMADIMKAVVDEFPTEKLDVFSMVDSADWLGADDRKGFAFDPDSETVVVQ